MSIGAMEIDVPEHAGTHATAAVGYVRDHDLDVTRTDGSDAGLAATVLQVRRLGPIVRLELRRLDTDETFEAAMSAERFRGLELRPGETVFVCPRRMRVFVETAVNSG
jgi:sulfate transport system ATP-binding protein